MDNFIYFSKNRLVEEKFEKDFGFKMDTDFNGQIGHFLGISFQCTKHENNDVSILMSQEAFIDELVNMAELGNDDITLP